MGARDLHFVYKVTHWNDQRDPAGLTIKLLSGSFHIIINEMNYDIRTRMLARVVKNPVIVCKSIQVMSVITMLYDIID
jgi:hypothetical protein